MSVGSGSRAPVRRRAAWLALTAVLVVGALAPGVAGAGYFEAEGLSECVGYTEQDLTIGTELPFGGIRVFARDAQRGRSRTFCLTIEKDLGQGEGCCYASADIVLPKGLRRDAESLRLIAAPSCFVHADMYPRSKAWQLRRQLDNFGVDEVRRRKRSIPERYDDRVHGIKGFLSCWGGET